MLVLNLRPNFELNPTYEQRPINHWSGKIKEVQLNAYRDQQKATEVYKIGSTCGSLHLRRALNLQTQERTETKIQEMCFTRQASILSNLLTTGVMVDAAPAQASFSRKIIKGRF